MPQQIKWCHSNALDLIESLEDGTELDSVPQTAGVYLWRREYVAPAECMKSSDVFEKWVCDVADGKAGAVGRVALSHCMWSEGLTLGGGGLTPEKIQTLRRITSSRSKRQALINFIETFTDFSHTVYFGQTSNLRKRAREHLKGKTGLLSYIENELQISWQDMAFYFCSLTSDCNPKQETKAMLQLMELLGQRILTPLGTTRPG